MAVTKANTTTQTKEAKPEKVAQGKQDSKNLDKNNPEKKGLNKKGQDKKGRVYATGRRKECTARVWIKSGTGKFSVNGRDINTYLGRPALVNIVNQPFSATNTRGQFDVTCTVAGGGLAGQAGAVRHGISRALDEFDPSFHTVLRQGGFLTRDSRAVERKKYGRKKARRRFQFSKR